VVAGARPRSTGEVGFVFRRAEGELMPPRLAAMLHPELEDFGLGEQGQLG
jgi:hypothetical protein